MLLSTHILSEAQQICDRVLIINKGKIIAEDTPERLQAHLRGAHRVVLQVRGDGEGLDAVIHEVPGVSLVTRISDGTFEISSTPGQDIRSRLARAVLDAGYDLLVLNAVGVSLEEVFIELTRDETNGPDPYLDDPSEIRQAGPEVGQRAAEEGADA